MLCRLCEGTAEKCSATPWPAIPEQFDQRAAPRLRLPNLACCPDTVLATPSVSALPERSGWRSVESARPLPGPNVASLLLVNRVEVGRLVGRSALPSPEQED